ncbi:MAG: DUF3142 domain-containing protein [Gammaproteobacteria bacterium]
MNITIKMCLPFLFAALSACKPAAAPKTENSLAHDAYVWQQVWTPALKDALVTASPWIKRWRVLAAKVERGGRFSAVDADAHSLANSGKPVVAVIRINGQLTDWDAAQVAAESLAVAAKWQQTGIPVAGLEIDHDCPVSRLGAYARFLSQLRPAVQSRNWPLTVTALPAWLDAPALPALLANIDGAVLQVHSVVDPQHGLFDRRQARVWTERFAALSPVPFLVALPTYGSRVVWDKQQQLVAVESEVPLALSAASEQELSVAPQAVAALLDEWRRRMPAGFAGIAWFRLPTRDDRRAWSLSTWQTVLQGRDLHATLKAYAKPGAYTGLQDIFLRNDGAIDTPFPATLRITADRECTSADAIGVYHFAAAKPVIKFHRSQPASLQAGRQAAVGWVRCADQEIRIDVER